MTDFLEIERDGAVLLVAMKRPEEVLHIKQHIADSCPADVAGSQFVSRHL